jgi:Phosphatidylinositol transfer protein/PH domain
MVCTVEFRIPLPFTLTEYRIGQLYMVAKTSLEEKAVEVVENYAYTSESEHAKMTGGQPGQFTFKKMIASAHLPSWLRPLFNDSWCVEERSWNAFPYCKTLFTVPMLGKVEVDLDSMHAIGDCTEPNICNSDNPKRSIQVLDIVTDPLPSNIAVSEISSSKCPDILPLSSSWRDPVSSKVKMTAYKHIKVKCSFPFGLQGRVESFIVKFIKGMVLNGHRKLVSWVDEWYGMSMDELRNFEKDMADKMAADKNPVPATDSATADPQSPAHEETSISSPKGLSGSSNVLLSGYLFKLADGYLTRGWNLRYFVLNKSVLQYFTDAREQKYKESIDLLNATIIYTGEIQDREFTFEVIPVDHRPILLSGVDEQQTRNWFVAIQKAAANMEIPVSPDFSSHFRERENSTTQFENTVDLFEDVSLGLKPICHEISDPLHTGYTCINNQSASNHRIFAKMKKLPTFLTEKNRWILAVAIAGLACIYSLGLILYALCLCLVGLGCLYSSNTLLFVESSYAVCIVPRSMYTVKQWLSDNRNRLHWDSLILSTNTDGSLWMMRNSWFKPVFSSISETKFNHVLTFKSKLHTEIFILLPSNGQNHTKIIFYCKSGSLSFSSVDRIRAISGLFNALEFERIPMWPKINHSKKYMLMLNHGMKIPRRPHANKISPETCKSVFNFCKNFKNSDESSLNEFFADFMKSLPDILCLVYELASGKTKELRYLDDKSKDGKFELNVKLNGKIDGVNWVVAKNDRFSFTFPDLQIVDGNFLGWTGFARIWNSKKRYVISFGENTEINGGLFDIESGNILNQIHGSWLTSVYMDGKLIDYS